MPCRGVARARATAVGRRLQGSAGAAVFAGVLLVLAGGRKELAWQAPAPPRLRTTTCSWCPASIGEAQQAVAEAIKDKRAPFQQPVAAVTARATALQRAPTELPETTGSEEGGGNGQWQWAPRSSAADVATGGSSGGRRPQRQSSKEAATQKGLSAAEERRLRWVEARLSKLSAQHKEIVAKQNWLSRQWEALASQKEWEAVFKGPPSVLQGLPTKP